MLSDNWTAARRSAPSCDNSRCTYPSRPTVRGSAGCVVSNTRSSTGGVPSSASVTPGTLVKYVAEAGPRIRPEERVLVLARVADALAVEPGECVDLGATNATCLEHNEATRKQTSTHDLLPLKIHARTSQERASTDVTCAIEQVLHERR
jgi:hypothetical protein